MHLTTCLDPASIRLFSGMRRVRPGESGVWIGKEINGLGVRRIPAIGGGKGSFPFNVPPERKRRARMRRLAPLFLASALVLAIGCTVDEEGNIWIDPCLGTCLADEVCFDDGAVAACYPMSDCQSPYYICDYDDGTAGCVDLDYDPYNCGGCGIYCDGVCSFGVCQSAGWSCADVGLDDCVDYCADLISDDANCGYCGNWCDVGGGEFCADGACQVAGGTCEDYGLTTCPDGCADLLTDPYNCGDCGIECVLGCDGAGNCN
jgi:hypothetical protein